MIDFIVIQHASKEKDIFSQVVVDLIHKYIASVEWLKVISFTVIKMTDDKLCTMNLNHLMININIWVNSECIECRSYAEFYTEFIQRHANYKKIIDKFLIHTVSQKYLIEELI